MSNKKEKYDDDKKAAQDVAMVVRIFILILVIDIIFIAFAMYCLFTSGISPLIMVLLFIAMLTPGIGFIVAIGVIVYHFSKKNKPVPTAGFHFF